jgi:3-oxoacyl-(acyl-carrier-protein) synthase
MQLGTGADGPIHGRRVAITGLGAVTCCGIGIDALWDGLLHPSVVGGPVTDWDPERWFGPKEVRQVDRFAQFSIAAADLAVTDASPLAWVASRPWRSRWASTTNAGPVESHPASSP